MVSRRQFLATAVSAASPPRHNIIVILADDLGYGDLGCYGSPHGATPHLDRLASDAARLTQHYTCSPVCSPARAGLLTGLVPDRTGVTGVLREEDDARGLDLRLPTLANKLQAQGLHTAIIGKWHLGMSEPYWPRRRGFAHFWGYLSGTIDYYSHVSRGGGGKGKRVTYKNGSPFEADGYFPELATRKAVEFVEANAARPYFLYLPLALPHEPIQVPERWSAPFRSKAKGQQADYLGMVHCLDDTVGQLRAALERTGQWDRTIVVFLSDHGWVKKLGQRGVGSNGPLRGGKYEVLEGGLRVPCIVRWPGVTRAGSVIDSPSWSLDWFPTLSGAASRDGRDIRKQLAGAAGGVREFFWRFQDDLVKTPLSYAIRRGDWKLVDIGGERRLYDLGRDPGESADQLGARPKVAADLDRRLRAWRRSINA